jgi:hypothetical protein
MFTKTIDRQTVRFNARGVAYELNLVRVLDHDTDAQLGWRVYAIRSGHCVQSYEGATADIAMHLAREDIGTDLEGVYSQKAA